MPESLDLCAIDGRGLAGVRLMTLPDDVARPRAHQILSYYLMPMRGRLAG